jgi:hypothetical protein
MKLVPFTSDVTPPLGSPLCGGWIKPAETVVDHQFAHGVILQPDSGDAIVLMAVDWCWIRTEAHRRWRAALADALGTQPSRVCIHCVHPHDAPMASPDGDRLLEKEGSELRSMLPGVLEDTIKRNCAAAVEARKNFRNVTHIGTGLAKVDKVACNRRVIGPTGKLEAWRGSSCKDAKARSAPDGLIDPYMKCITFWDGEACLAALHYYATHPMSYYGEGGLSCDFAGIARERRGAEVHGITQIYFNGCGGNVSAGKYNDGSHENRPVLAERIHAAMKAAYESTQRQPVRSSGWAVEPVHIPMSEEFTRAYFTKGLKNPKGSKAERIKGAMGVAWWDDHDAGGKVDLTCLRINNVYILGLCGEAFIEYQLAAQQIAATGDRNPTKSVPELARASEAARPKEGLPGMPADKPFVAVAAYGDCGPAYIPTVESFPQGGYEVTMAWNGPKTEDVLKRAIAKLLQA